MVLLDDRTVVVDRVVNGDLTLQSSSMINDMMPMKNFESTLCFQLELLGMTRQSVLPFKGPEFGCEPKYFLCSVKVNEKRTAPSGRCCEARGVGVQQPPLQKPSL
jgi:hypothetical protein